MNRSRALSFLFVLISLASWSQNAQLSRELANNTELLKFLDNNNCLSGQTTTERLNEIIRLIADDTYLIYITESCSPGHNRFNFKAATLNTNKRTGRLIYSEVHKIKSRKLDKSTRSEIQNLLNELERVGYYEQYNNLEEGQLRQIFILKQKEREAGVVFDSNTFASTANSGDFPSKELGKLIEYLTLYL